MEDDLLKVFVQESKEHLETLEPTLLALEDRHEKSSIEAAFRAVHSIKGASGFFGLEKISVLSHQMENIMALVRDGKLAITKELTDTLLMCTDKLKVMIEDVNNHNNVQIHNEVNALRAILQSDIQLKTDKGASAETIPVVEETLPSLEEQGEKIPELLKNFKVIPETINTLLEEGKTFYLATIIASQDNTSLQYFDELETLGDIVDTYLDSSEIKGFNNFNGGRVVLHILFATLMQPDLVYLTFNVPADQIDEMPREVMIKFTKHIRDDHSSNAPVAKKTQNSSEPFVKKPFVAQKTGGLIEADSKDDGENDGDKLPIVAGNAKKADNTIRVSVSLLDDLMNLAGEMVLGRNQLMRLSGEVADQIPGFASVLQHINLITSEMQEKVMLTRLQPINLLFSKFTRIVRDLAYKLNKDVRLKLSGKEVELDRSILEALSDPLTHIIRNCVDHGIESGDERESHGKAKFGLVSLSAKHVGGQVHIEIADDGRGLNLPAIKEKALQKGIITPEKADKMTDAEVINLIFCSGLSTAEKVTDISGRGVGMDVVRNNIERLNGSVVVDSAFGEGTRFCLRLPLTLAIIPAMIIGIRDRKFAVPQINLEEIVQLDETHYIEDVRGTQVLRLRGNLLPLVDLRVLLKMPADEKKSEEENQQGWDNVLSGSGNHFVLVLKVEDKRYGLLVDELFDNEEIVVKPLCSYLKNTQCYAGATLMGDGKVAMILDTDGIAKLAQLVFSDFEQQMHETKRNYTQMGAIQQTDQGERQSLLLFRNGTDELFSVNLSMVSRIEHVKKHQIQSVGTEEYLEYGRSSLRLIRLDRFMPVKPSPVDLKEYYIIVPQLVKKPMGILASQIEDVVDASVALDEETIRGTGILGSAILTNRLTIFLDLYNLFERIDPETYKTGDLNQWPEVLSSKRLLVAEDTAFFRTITYNYLKPYFRRIEMVPDGLIAWEKLNLNNYDLVLSDLEMPNMNGFQLIENIRNSERLNHLPVVALTAFANPSDIQKGYRCGFDAYEIKLDKEKLLSTVKALLLKNTHATTPVTV